jgi:hypothetical protein
MKKAIFLILLFLSTFMSCHKKIYRLGYDNSEALLTETERMPDKPYLKAHARNGDVYILGDDWTVDTVQNLVSGRGIQYNAQRVKKEEGNLSVPVSDILLFETNEKIVQPEKQRVLALTILAGVEVALGVFCLTNPKACFGSCPTFYLNKNDNFHYADAEGFSNAILPSMEYGDVDALGEIYAEDKNFTITLKNEALETHCINEVKLLAIPKGPEQSVFHTPGNDFYVCGKIYPVQEAYAVNKDVTSFFQKDDKVEYFTETDTHNLSSKEEIYLSFDKVSEAEDLGLILHFRQSLLTTYLFYSSMGYMGDQVTEYFAMLESSDFLKKKFNSIMKELGGIDAYVLNEETGKWEYQASFNETGPIAINKQFLPVKGRRTSDKVRVKLILNKGLWRLDYVALTDIKSKAEPVELTPSDILCRGVSHDRALIALADSADYLITMPGDEYDLNFKLPYAHMSYDVFLYSKGYYLEWMRQSWLQDKDVKKLRQLVFQPQDYLKEEASRYKLYESTMEEQFWNSKIDTKNFSYYEN